jgi:hypothetical protein
MCGVRPNSPDFEGPAPADWAFLAMAYHRLGQKDKADDALTRLRKSRQSKRWAQDKESEALQREAEEAPPQPAERRDAPER